jgi:hypothetical protein
MCNVIPEILRAGGRELLGPMVQNVASGPGQGVKKDGSPGKIRDAGGRAGTSFTAPHHSTYRLQ